ncbi:MAG: hypothetical protein V9E98_00755 [Candidatus Nanopelagicales bacterium]
MRTSRAITEPSGGVQLPLGGVFHCRRGPSLSQGVLGGVVVGDAGGGGPGPKEYLATVPADRLGVIPTRAPAAVPHSTAPPVHHDCQARLAAIDSLAAIADALQPPERRTGASGVAEPGTSTQDASRAAQDPLS